METHQNLEPETRQGENTESAQKLQQDEKKDIDPKMQLKETEKVTEELEGAQQSGPNINEALMLHCLQSIFAFLTINDLVRSERVCLDWREFLLQYLPFVQNYRIAYCNDSPCKVPDRKHSFRTIKLAMRKGEINKMISKMGKYFVRVYSDCIDEEDSNALAMHCPHLEYLLLSGTHVKLIFDDETDEESQRRKLTGTFLTNLRMNLKTLGLTFFKPFKVEYLQSAIHRLTGLTRLDLNSISVETLQSVSSLLEQMPLLEHLSLMEYERGRESGIDPPCFDRLSRLRELHLWGNEFVTDSWVEAAASCEALRVFNVGTCFEVGMKTVIALCQRRSELKELVVSKLRVTNADVEACVAFCRNLELLDISWCTRLTRNVLARLSRPNTRPLIVRLHGTRISENNIPYEGLILRVDLPPELYNPLQVRYAKSPCHDQGRGSVEEAEYVVLEHAIAIDLPDIYAADAPPAADVAAEGDIQMENAMSVVDSPGVDDAINEENDKQVEDAVHKEDAERVEIDICVEEIMHVENNVPVEAVIEAVDAKNGRREEGKVAKAAVDDLDQENAVQVVDKRFLPIERRAEDQLHAGNNPLPVVHEVNGFELIAIHGEEVEQNGLVQAVNRQIMPESHQEDMADEGDISEEYGLVEVDAYAENEDYPDHIDEEIFIEDDLDAEDYALAEDYIDDDVEDDDDDDDDDDINVITDNRIEPQVNGFRRWEDDIYPEDDVFENHEIEMARLRVVEMPIRVAGGLMAIDGIVPLAPMELLADVAAHHGNNVQREQVLDQMYADYGLVGGNDAANDDDLFADQVLFARDEMRREDEDGDCSDLSL